MSEAVRKTLVSLFVERWLATSNNSWRTLPTPSGPPVAHSDGPDPDRVLLFGSGISMGYGMKTHDLALAGQLARQVSDLTGRGVRVDVVTGENLTVENALKNLTVARLRELDVVIATPGTLEKLLLMPVSTWRARVDYLLDHFAANAPASLRVLFVGVPEVSRIVRMPRLLGFLAARSALALNRSLEAACAPRPYVEYIPFQPTERTGRDGTGRTYELWASLIAPSVAEALNEHQKVAH
jgi:hypothetical protein